MAGFLAVWRRDVLGQAATMGMACTAALVISPISRGYYHTELVPGVLLLPLWLLSRNMPRAARWMAWTPVALVLAHYLALPITGRLGLLGIGTATWYATGLTMLVVGGRIGQATEKSIPAPKARLRLHATAGTRPPGAGNDAELDLPVKHHEVARSKR